MAGVVRDWRIEFMEGHPRLFRSVSGKPHASEAYPNCDQGWQDLLERACVRIEAALGDDDSFEALQIKE
jgi:hypothetical protein